TDDEEVDELTDDYEGRYLAFRLNFSSKVEVSANGKNVIRAGRMLGEGIWEHQEEAELYSYEDLDHTHPDFIWLPTQAFQDNSGYGNPYVDPQVVQRLVEGRDVSAPAKKPVTLNLVFAPRFFAGSATTAAMAKKEVQKIIRREGIKN